MKQFLVLLLTIALTACEKVVDIRLKEAGRKYVIEGVITNRAGKTQVKISQTKNFSTANDPEGVEAESVSISEEGGATIYLSRKTSGIYESDAKGTPGKTYILRVVIHGTEYKAVSQMPRPVPIDRLYITRMNRGSTADHFVNASYQDPAEKGNLYRFVQQINGTKEKHIHTRNDDLTNGCFTTVTLFTHDYQLKKGDAVDVELQSIDANVYKYWYSLAQGADGGQSASPANPVTNISGDALGYFSAHSVSTKSILVQ